MDICFLETVAAVYRYRSFAEAAADRMLSQSTVSKHVSGVEKELGVKLFNRATKTSFVTLTEAGLLLLEDIDSYVAEYAGIVRKAELIRAEAENRLSLGFLPVAGSLGENRIISTFCKTHPKVKISLVPSDGAGLVKMLATGRADGVFTLGRLAEDTRRLTVDGETLEPDKYGAILTYKSNRMYCAVSDRHPLADRTELTLEDLRDETFLINNSLEEADPGARSQQFLQENLEGYRHQFMDYTLKSILYDFVAAGNGVILSSTYTGEEYRGCRFLPLREDGGTTQGWFVYRKDIQSSVLRAFRKCAMENGVDMTAGTAQAESRRP